MYPSIRLPKFIICSIVGVCLFLTSTQGQIRQIRRVVALSELGVSSPAVAAVLRDLDAGLEADSTYRIEFYSEYLETALFSDEASQANIRAWFIQKYQLRKPDVVIAVGPTPIKFMVEAHEKFFSGVPIVFCCSSEQQADYPKLDAHFTGTWIDFDTDSTLDAVIRLLPRTKHVVVVGGVSAFDRHLEDVVEKTQRKHEALQFIYLTNLPIETVLERVKDLPHDTIILFTSFSADTGGRNYNPNPEIVRSLAETANAPVFTLADTLVGQGAVGGHVVRYLDQGKSVAAITLKILHGTRPQEIAISKDTGTYIFDWRALRHWGMNEDSLSPGSTVLNRQPTFWELYRRYVVAGIVILIVQALIIFGLLRQRAVRRKAEQAQRESEERFRLAMNNVASGLYTVDLEGMVTYVNPAAEAMFGWMSAELLGKKMHDVTHYKHPDGTPFPASDCPGLQILQRGVERREHEDTFIRKDGSFLPVVLSASPLRRDGETIGVVVGFRDDTLRRDAERAIRESEERFRLIANAAPVMIWMSGLDRRCNYFNQVWLEFTGRSLNKELGNGWAEGVYAEDLDRCWNTYVQAFDRREPFQMEYRLRRNDGEYRWISDHGVPRYNSDGSFAGYIGACIDVTQQKLAETALSTVTQRLIQAHEEERTRIARELHDDINQRVALLSVHLDGLKHRLPASVAKLRREIEAASQQITELGSDVQALSHRLHSSKLQYLGLAAAATSFCKELCDRAGVEIAFSSENISRELPEEITLCLFRVLQEALQNAVKYSGSQHIQVSLRGGTNEIELIVHDGGIGFEVEEAMKGHGLGLTSMRERLKLVDGGISVHSKPQCGTTIHVRVPFVSEMKSVGATG
jgi:PAS domain S-box-containing protein